MSKTKSFRQHISILSKWNPDQARRVIVPDLGPNVWEGYQQKTKGKVYSYFTDKQMTWTTDFSISVTILL